MFFALLFVLHPLVAMADTHTLNIGGATITLSETCDSEHKLNVLYGGTVYCAEATTDTLTDTLHVSYNGTTYSICNGTCGGGSGGGEYVMPETPFEPVVIDDNCEWEQTNENAYLLSDGNQWFDTGVTVDTSVNIFVTAKVINGHSARIFGTTGGTCYYDMTINASRTAFFKIGTQNSSASISLTQAQSTQKIQWYTQSNGATNKWIYRIFEDGKSSRTSKTLGSACTSTETIKVFNNNLVSSVNQTDSGGMKLYSILLKNSSGTTIHNYQPVAAGTNICGYTVPTNAMYDFVDKRVYLPAGTGQMGYGVDP